MKMPPSVCEADRGERPEKRNHASPNIQPTPGNRNPGSIITEELCHDLKNGTSTNNLGLKNL